MLVFGGITFPIMHPRDWYIMYTYICTRKTTQNVQFTPPKIIMDLPKMMGLGILAPASALGNTSSGFKYQYQQIFHGCCVCISFVKFHRKKCFDVSQVWVPRVAVLWDIHLKHFKKQVNVS